MSNHRPEEEEKLSAGPGDESRTSSCSSETPTLPLPPDGGYGWVVCASAFFCMVLLDGILFSFGVFFLELLEYFNESKAKTAMVGSVLMGMSLLGGPIVSVMVNLWGLRPVAMVGALVASSSIGFSLLAPNITVLTITYGFFGGFGISMVYLPAILAVGFYFEKRRALANGITMSGSGIGTFIYSPLCNYLQSEYSWKGAVLILSGITLHCLALGALFRPLNTVRRGRAHSQSGTSSGSSNSSKYVDVLESISKDEQIRLINKTGATQMLLRAESAVKSQSYSNLHRGGRAAGEKPTPPTAIKLPDACDTLSASTGYLPDTPAPPEARTHKSGELHPSRGRKGSPWMTTLYRKDLFYSGSFLRIPDYHEGNPGASLYSLSAIKDDNTSHSGEDVECCQRWSDIRATIQQMTGLRLVKSPIFLISMASMVLWTTHSTVLNFLPDYAVHRKARGEQAAFLLSIIGITNTLARVLAGWISDHPRVNVLWVNMAACLVGGITCCFVPHTNVYYLMATEAGVFGFCMGTWTSLRPIVLVEMLGLDNLTNAFGLVAMFQGLAFSFGPPIAGFLYDYTESYVLLFSIAGGALFISGLLIIVMFIINKRNKAAFLSSQIIE